MKLSQSVSQSVSQLVVFKRAVCLGSKRCCSFKKLLFYLLSKPVKM